LNLVKALQAKRLFYIDWLKNAFMLISSIECYGPFAFAPVSCAQANIKQNRLAVVKKNNDPKFEGMPLKVMYAECQIWFLGADVGRILGMSGSAAKITRNLELQEARTIKDGSQKDIYIAESGLWALVFRCRRPVAKRFRKWLVTEMLPSLNKMERPCNCQDMEQEIPEITDEDGLQEALVCLLNNVDARTQRTTAEIQILEDAVLLIRRDPKDFSPPSHDSKE
jgi:prophage antirepressor-like protein